MYALNNRQIDIVEQVFQSQKARNISHALSFFMLYQAKTRIQKNPVLGHPHALEEMLPLTWENMEHTNQHRP